MFHKHVFHCFRGNQSFWHTSITTPPLPQHSVLKKRQSAASHTHIIDISAEFSQTLKYGVEGGRKCFLTSLACLPKKKMKWKKERKEVLMLLHCLNAPSPTSSDLFPLSNPQPPALHPNPSRTHSLSTLSPAPHLSFFLIFFFSLRGQGEGGGGQCRYKQC